MSDVKRRVLATAKEAEYDGRRKKFRHVFFGENYDAKLVVQGEDVRAHMKVLDAASPWFARNLHDGRILIHGECITVEAVKEFLVYLYGYETAYDAEFSVAKAIGLAHLFDRIEFYAAAKTAVRFSIANCAPDQLHKLFAIVGDDKHLQDQLVLRLECNIRTVDVSTLSKPVMCKVLGSYKVDSLDKLLAIGQWMAANPNQDSKDLIVLVNYGRVASNVRKLREENEDLKNRMKQMEEETKALKAQVASIRQDSRVTSNTRLTQDPVRANMKQRDKSLDGDGEEEKSINADNSTAKRKKSNNATPKNQVQKKKSPEQSKSPAKRSTPTNQEQIVDKSNENSNDATKAKMAKGMDGVDSPEKEQDNSEKKKRIRSEAKPLVEGEQVKKRQKPKAGNASEAGKGGGAVETNTETSQDIPVTTSQVKQVKIAPRKSLPLRLRMSPESKLKNNAVGAPKKKKKKPKLSVVDPPEQTLDGMSSADEAKISPELHKRSERDGDGKTKSLKRPRVYFAPRRTHFRRPASRGMSRHEERKLRASVGTGTSREEGMTVNSVSRVNQGTTSKSPSAAAESGVDNNAKSTKICNASGARDAATPTRLEPNTSKNGLPKRTTPEKCSADATGDSDSKKCGGEAAAEEKEAVKIKTGTIPSAQPSKPTVLARTDLTQETKKSGTEDRSVGTPDHDSSDSESNNIVFTFTNADFDGY